MNRGSAGLAVWALALFFAPPPARAEMRAVKRQDKIVKTDGTTVFGTIVARGEKAILVFSDAKRALEEIPAAEVKSVEEGVPEGFVEIPSIGGDAAAPAPGPAPGPGIGPGPALPPPDGGEGPILGIPPGGAPPAGGGARPWREIRGEIEKKRIDEVKKTAEAGAKKAADEAKKLADEAKKKAERALARRDRGRKKGGNGEGDPGAEPERDPRELRRLAREKFEQEREKLIDQWSGRLDQSREDFLKDRFRDPTRDLRGRPDEPLIQIPETDDFLDGGEY